MNKLIVVYGTVSSGKSTLASRLAKTIACNHYSSDNIRTELSGDIGGKSRGLTKDGKPFDVFNTLRERVEADLLAGLHVVGDSTGMSLDFKQMVNEFREKYDSSVVSLTLDFDTWKQREALRNDRWTLVDNNIEPVPFIMPKRAFNASTQVRLHREPDLMIDTSNLTTEEVFNRVWVFLHKG